MTIHPASVVDIPPLETSRDAFRRALVVIAFVTAGLGLSTLPASGGCSTSHGSGPQARSAQSIRETPDPELPRTDFDPARAFLSLAEIEPIPAPPAQAQGPLSPQPSPVGTGPPLSGRGATYLLRSEELIAEERFTEASRVL